MASESTTLELRVGLFMLVGLAIIGYMVVVLGRFGNGVKPSYTLTVELPNASGLLKNSKVLLSGAQVGSVVDGPNLLDHAAGWPWSSASSNRPASRTTPGSSSAAAD